MLHVPTDPDYGSLNLAQAVQIVAYECRMAALEPGSAEPAEPMPSRREMEYFFEHLEAALLDNGFLDPDNPKQLMRRLRRFFHRGDPTQVELNILRGILKRARDPLPGSATWQRVRHSPAHGEGATIPKQDDQE
jgi:tRNA/rRNA methyltransferase/tRNA (cytidine32/uridine32-2'-O)-methyltransferase